jgi:uncharacterized protein
VITLDTSGIFAFLNRRDSSHERVKALLAAESKPWMVPASTLGEVSYLIEQRSTQDVLEAFLEDLEKAKYALDCGEQDFARVRALVRRYADLPLGLVDAAVMACAERNGGRVLTLDWRHLGVVAREGRIAMLPT